MDERTLSNAIDKLIVEKGEQPLELQLEALAESVAYAMLRLSTSKEHFAMARAFFGKCLDADLGDADDAVYVAAWEPAAANGNEAKAA
jgi:hypothetical protein